MSKEEEITNEQKEKLTKLTEENFWQIAKQVHDDVKALNEQLDEKTANTEEAQTKEPKK